MRALLSICTTALAVTSLACARTVPATLTDAERGAIADSVLTITRGFATAATRLDVNGFAPHFSSDPALTFAADGNLLLIPHDSLMSMYRTVYSGMSRMEFVWDTLQVSVLSPEIAVVSGAAHDAVTDKTGRTARQGVAVTYVFVHRNNAWQLLHGHASHRPL
jgi:uncharacterized protein (TIGR02246 family)